MISRRTAELCVAILTLVFGVVIAFGSREFGVGWSKSGPQPGTFPYFIGWIIAAASLGNIALALRKSGSTSRHSIPFVTADQLRRLFGFAWPIVALVSVSLWLGLYVGTALYMFGTLVFQNKYHWAKATVIALALPVFIYLLIERTFQVGMLKGPLEAALGI
ncbi:MAG: tripartite tricarboxylate transporter TctB family protein [Hyphomicrobiaceae bacterium]|nr:tripartite tricarboxylate transporter TctB family protein [Hyphomicrobiaceae bacterium]